jgi:ferredoxin
MDASLQQQTVFHVTGKRPAAGLDAVDGLGLRPALLARYRDLTKLRYDFPVVLVDGAQGDFVRSLSEVVDTLLREIARPGIEGEGLRKHALRVERELRRMLAAGERGSLAALWDEAVARLDGPAGRELGEYLRQAGAALPVDGELADCDEHLPARLFTHAWRSAHERKCREQRAQINTLIVRLADILRADFLRSDAGRRPESLKAALGPRHHELFDFEALSRLLRHATTATRLPDARRSRIEWALSVLRSQRFFGGPGDAAARHADPDPWSFAFDDGSEAVAAFRQRLPAMVELVKALSLAALEVDGRYVESSHDAFFDAFDERALGPRDLELFPGYLVRLTGGRGATAANLALMELLSSGIPVKVLVQVDDVFERSGLGDGHFAFGVRSVQLASTAIGLNDCFVLQSASSNLFRLRHSIERGMSYPGAALFSVFSGAAARAGQLPCYLVSAAAMQSRAFPVFTYDPAAGPDLADRFSLEDNPQPEVDWPVVQLQFADAELQRVIEPLAFTLADFVVCDARHAAHFARVPSAAWNAGMVTVAESLAHPPATGSAHIPYLLAVDGEDVLQRVIVDDKVMLAARRCRETWHRLQELGGVHSSHAQRLLAREKAAWEAGKRDELDALRATTGPPVAAAAAAAGASVVPTEAQGSASAAPAAAERSKDEAWIETIRCSSCNECTQINDRMFAYDDNKQAYIKDLAAGTYRQLIEAAESCQLSIIHPGKPRDPNEPGLVELVERAQPFL